MLVDLLDPAGPDLARRWLAALLLVDQGDRETLVAEVERRIVETYAAREELDVVHPPREVDGHVEQVITTYSRAPKAPRATGGKRRPKHG